MDSTEKKTIKLVRAEEQLRQERQVFDQRKNHESKWFRLRLIMGYSAVFLLIFVMFISSHVILNAENFSATTVNLASGALFIDVLGLLIGAWKIVLNPQSITKLSPVTNQTIEEQNAAN